MKIPIEYLGVASVIVSFWETDDLKKRRLTVLSRLFRTHQANDACIVEALVACAEMAVTPEWKKFIKALKGRFLVKYDDRFEDPSPQVRQLFEWLRDCYYLAGKEELSLDCLEVEGRYLICR